MDLPGVERKNWQTLWNDRMDLYSSYEHNYKNSFVVQHPLKLGEKYAIIFTMGQ